MSESPIASPKARAEAVVQALREQGQLPEGALETVEAIEERLDWHNGARVVAKAWTDPGYHARLLADGTTACAELGFEGPQGEYIVVLEDTDTTKNVIVCTQCSCTAWPVLGLPPDWYKRPEYRARVVREPRRVLRELGLDLAPEIRVRVWDTTAETRFLVLPQRPAGTESWSEDDLAELVTRESMIGIARVPAPG
ncbi:MAG: nitrile hydratase subunit alpha [Myxococcota bacterium]